MPPSTHAQFFFPAATHTPTTKAPAMHTQYKRVVMTAVMPFDFAKANINDPFDFATLNTFTTSTTPALSGTAKVTPSAILSIVTTTSALTTSSMTTSTRTHFHPTIPTTQAPHWSDPKYSPVSNPFTQGTTTVLVNVFIVCFLSVVTVTVCACTRSTKWRTKKCERPVERMPMVDIRYSRREVGRGDGYHAALEQAGDPCVTPWSGPKTYGGGNTRMMRGERSLRGNVGENATGIQTPLPIYTSMMAQKSTYGGDYNGAERKYFGGV